MTTNEMDHTTDADRSALVGYCEKCEEWRKFTRTGNDRCPECGSRYSTQTGQQITSQRSFDPVRMKVKKRKK